MQRKSASKRVGNYTVIATVLSCSLVDGKMSMTRRKKLTAIKLDEEQEILLSDPAGQELLGAHTKMVGSKMVRVVASCRKRDNARCGG